MTETTEQGYVQNDEWPACPECGHQGAPAVTDTRGGLRYGLRCEECGRELTLVGSYTIDEEADKYYAAVGHDFYGTGQSEEEAVENMLDYYDGDDDEVHYRLWVAKDGITVTRYGKVIADSPVLHHLGKHKTSVDK